MKVAQCYHFRIRDTNEYGMDVEQFIKSIEKEYKIDIRSLPQWKQIIEQLHAATTDYNRKLQKYKFRKALIIDKIYTQNTRASPFELTEDLVRTADTWKALALKRKNPSKSFSKSTIEDDEDKPYDDIEYNEIAGENTVAHPNTEIVATPEQVEDLEADVVTAIASHLPANICINQHTILSSLRSDESYLSYRSIVNDITTPEEPNEYLILEQTSAIRSMPKEIAITNPTLKKQCLKFSLMNCSSDYMHVRFKSVTEREPFKNIKILPILPTKLYPGISVTYKLVFKLSQTEEFSPSALYFRVGRNEEPTEALLIPIVSRYTKSRKIFVTKAVSIAPVYPWHINKHTCGFPTELVKISNGDDCHYHLHIIKCYRDFAKESTSIASVNAISLNTSSILLRADEENVEPHSDIFSNSKDDNMEAVTEVESLKTIDFIGLVVHEAIESALEAFVFEHTYLHLRPHTTRYIPIYLAKAEHTGFHQCYYDFEIWDFESDQYILTKTIQVFAEVLPHPVKIQPEILDMSNSPITHGYCEDSFIVNNTHKLFNVKAYIKLTTKMKKLFHVSPTEASVPANSNVKFTVRLCTKNVSSAKIDELAHFTFKIIFSGVESVYKNVPPYFYEIIVPCAPEFKKIYSEKFFSEARETSDQELTSSKILVRKSM